jgi:GxxExxY protein
MEENEISKVILDAAIAVHTELGGPGLLESYYENALKYELELRGLKVQTQMLVPVMYKGRVIGDPYRLDILVEDKVIVECKATEKNNPIFASQVNTYLHLLNCRLGIVINFGQNRIIDGWLRVTNNMPQ